MDVTQGSPGEEIPPRLSGVFFVFFLLAAAHKRVPKPVPLRDFGTGLPPAWQRAEAAKGQGFVGQTSEGVIHSVKADRLTFRLKFCDVCLTLGRRNSERNKHAPSVESVFGTWLLATRQSVRV